MDAAMTEPGVGGAVGQVEPSVGDQAQGEHLSCPSCSQHVTEGERFCEACGADLPPSPAPAEAAAAADETVAPADEAAARADETPAAADKASAAQSCAECGGDVADDGYCMQCGARAASPRDHFTEQPAPWVAAVCDRGIRHRRNEDAVALHAGPEPGSHAVLVVCDGVSSSTDSDVASLAAARAARDVLAVSDPQGQGTAATRVAATAKALESAAGAANAAVVAHTSVGPNPASCTFVAAVVDESLLVVGWVGDSRAYWLSDVGEPQLLTVDDSFAAEQIADGVPRADAERGPQAHAITRWLGIDAPDHTPRTASLDLPGPGWVVVCSDGLWNYCSEPRDVATLVEETSRGSGSDPLQLAGALVDWANAQGGQDNITVAVARVGPTRQVATAHPTQATAASAPQPEPPREEVRPDGNVLS